MTRIRKIINAWNAWRRRKRLERAYPDYAEINRMIRDAQKHHKQVKHLYKARVRFINRELRKAA